MITTVTLNVAIDKLYHVDTFETGEVTRVKECNATAGGKGLNVARVSTLLGEDVTATGIVGGHSGKYVEEMLKKDGIRSQFTHVDGESRSCVNIIDGKGKSTELLEPGVTVTEKQQEEFIALYKKLVAKSSVISISGSMPRGCDPLLYVKLVEIAKKNGKKVILDTSGENLAKGIAACPTLIKPNKDEIKSLLGVDIANKSDVIAAGKTLHSRGIPYVVISMGKHGAIVVCDKGVFEGNPPDIKAVNTVGCGDSMVAAFAVSMERGYTIEKALQFSIVVSSANAMCEKTGFFYKKDLDGIINTGTVTKLS